MNEKKVSAKSASTRTTFSQNWNTKLVMVAGLSKKQLFHVRTWLAEFNKSVIYKTIDTYGILISSISSYDCFNMINSGRLIYSIYILLYDQGFSLSRHHKFKTNFCILIIKFCAWCRHWKKPWCRFKKAHWEWGCQLIYGKSCWKKVGGNRENGCPTTSKKFARNSFVSIYHLQKGLWKMV